jgi:hypothetical protein
MYSDLANHNHFCATYNWVKSLFPSQGARLPKPSSMPFPLTQGQNGNSVSRLSILGEKNNSSELGQVEQQDFQSQPGIGIASQGSLQVFDLFYHFLS